MSYKEVRTGSHGNLLFEVNFLLLHQLAHPLRLHSFFQQLGSETHTHNDCIYIEYIYTELSSHDYTMGTCVCECWCGGSYKVFLSVVAFL